MIKRLYTHISSCLRYKLLGLVFMPVLLLMLVVIIMAFYWANGVSYQQLLMKVTSDLSVAHEEFIASEDRYLAELSRMANSYSLRDVMHENNNSTLSSLLQKYQTEANFDYLLMLDLEGCDYQSIKGCGYKKSALLQESLQGIPTKGIEVFSSLELDYINKDLSDRVFLPLENTPFSAPSIKKIENRGMVMHSFYPVIGADSKLKAILVGGVLLNGNFKLVDRLRDLIYSEGSLAKNGIGTVTIFLDDIRISTNVPKHTKLPQIRALGTRVSKEVRDKVLEKGLRWIDRAFVVSEWYISAYEPIIDVNGEHIGMLYTGFLESPFRAVYSQGLVFLIILFLAVVALCVLLAVLAAKSIFNPIEKMTKVISNLKAGKELRVGKVESQDEVSVLAQQFDTMLDELQFQREEIQTAAADLEVKVKTRTEQLQTRTNELQKNVDLLKRTREQLIAKEKFAAIGELAAGIAHEINNPTTVILGYTELMISELGEQAKPIQREADIIIKQVHRIRAIINNLLQYSRPFHQQNALVSVDINQVINDTLLLVKHDLSQHKIQLCLDLKSTINIKGNHQQLQQVLINLIVNAINAIQSSGKITIRTRNWQGKGIVFVIRDDGCGIPEDIKPRIFDPFFSRSKTGTGLGLAISYSILKFYNAEIAVRSKEGLGSSFFIWLRDDPQWNLTAEMKKNQI